MALGGRSPRRSGGSRVLVVALVVTLVVLLIDASIKSRSSSTGEHLSAQAWIDQVLPLIRESTEQGQQIYRLRTGGLTMSGSAIATEVHQTAAAAAATYQEAKKLVAPSTLGTAGGLFDACLLLRRQAAASVAHAFVAALAGPPTPSPSTSAELTDAGQKLASGDVLYHLFTENLPGVGVKMPASVWNRDARLYQSPTTTDYLTALRSKTNLTPVHRVTVQAVSTNPLPERVQSGVEVLPTVKSISVGVTVANLGNQVERDLTVTATDLPAIKYPSVQLQLAPLQPGAAQSVTLGPLYPVAGAPVTLTIKVNGPASSPVQPATKTLTLEMPSASVPLTSTTTTTVAPPPTTATQTSAVS